MRVAIIEEIPYRQERRRALSPTPKNVGRGERLASIAGGTALAITGLARGRAGGLALAAIGGGLLYRGLTGRCGLYRALGVSTAEKRPGAAISPGQGVKIEESVTILKPREEIYRYWRDLENLPRIMRHLVSVEEREGNRSHWVAKGPVGDVEWDAEVIRDTPGEIIAWKSTEESNLATAGSVRFVDAPGDRGVEVKVSLSYAPPAGRVGHAIAWLTGRDPQSEVREDLRNFKRVMETGAIATTEGQPRGHC